MVMPVMLSVVLPTLVRVVGRDLIWPSGTLPKPRLVGLNSTTVPAPLRLAVCGLPGALSATESAAVRDPRWVGVNVTLIVQLAPGATELPQLFVWAKSPGSAPVKPM